MKKNIFYLIASIIVIGLVVGLPFAFIKWNEQLINNTAILVPYIIAKVLFGLCLIAFVVLVFVKELARGQALFLLGSSIAMQFIPLFLRFGLNMGDFGLIYSILITTISLFIYIVFLGLVFVSGKKQLVSDKKYEGKTIDVYEEKD